MFRNVLAALKSVITRRSQKRTRHEPSNAWSRYATPDRFRFEVLGNAVFESSTSISDVLYLADDVFSDAPPEQRRAIATEAIEELLRNQLVVLEAVERDVSADELVEAARSILISDDRAAGSRVSLLATPAGVKLAEDPPDEIRELWRMP